MTARPDDDVEQGRAEGILLTDLSLRLAALDNGAASILARSHRQNGSHMTGLALPEELVAALKDRPLSELPERIVSFPMGKRNYACRVSVLYPPNDSTGQPMLALYVYPDTDVHEAIASFAEEYDLTERERQTLLGVANGLTCKEIAESMSISPNTVKSFLRLLMIKIGVPRRGAIIGKVLDHQRHKI